MAPEPGACLPPQRFACLINCLLDRLNPRGDCTAVQLADTVGSFPDTVGAITVPTLILYGTADGLCPPAGSMMLGDRIGAADKTVTAYEGLFHEILNEPERETVLEDIVGWLGVRVGSPAAAAAGSTRT